MGQTEFKRLVSRVPPSYPQKKRKTPKKLSKKSTLQKKKAGLPLKKLSFFDPFNGQAHLFDELPDEHLVHAAHGSEGSEGSEPTLRRASLSVRRAREGGEMEKAQEPTN